MVLWPVLAGLETPIGQMVSFQGPELSTSPKCPPCSDDLHAEAGGIVVLMCSVIVDPGQVSQLGSLSISTFLAHTPGGRIK